MFSLNRIVWYLVFSFLFITTSAQEEVENYPLEPVSDTISALEIFDNDEPLKLTLKYDISSFIKEKRKEEYFDAELVIYQSDTDSLVKNIRLKARGNFRKTHCFFPPIFLNFKTDPITGSDIEDIKKIKLVTHCSNTKSYQKYVMKEYLAYKMFNQITDLSFRVKLVDINYVDIGKKKRHYKQIGFLIEPDELLQKRLNAVEVEGLLMNGNTVQETEADRVAVFEYMIANTDWRFKKGHNMKFFKSLDRVTTKMIPIPYDFDYAGIVDAHYAIPQEWTSLKVITDREYMGYCRDNEEDYLKVIETFNEKKEDIFMIIKDCLYLSDKDKKQLLSFIDEFYHMAEDSQRMVKVLQRQCRGIEF